MKQNKVLPRPLAGLLCALCGAASAVSFLTPGGEGYVGLSDPPASSASYLWCALALCFALLYRHVYGVKRARPSAAMVCFALLFGLVNSLGVWLFSYDGWEALEEPLLLAALLLRAPGQAAPMLAGFAWLDRLLTERWNAQGDSRVVAKTLQRPRRWFHCHPVLTAMLCMLLCWSPYLICFFPGTVCWDLGEMAAQFFGLKELTTWHPVFLTWIFGGLIWLGRLAGSDNLGAGAYMLLQTLALSYALARTVYLLRRLGCRRAVRLGALAFFCFVPFFAGYAQFISKDTFYTAFLLLFCLDAVQLLHCREKNAIVQPSVLWGLFGWGLLSCLCRSNGLYVILPSAAALFCLGAKGKARLPLGAALAGCVAAALLFSGALLPALGIRDETASGLYSVCFQQSARVLRDHGDEVTEEEYAGIDRVLDAERLPELYESNISDPVKYTFRQYGQGAALEKEALARYRKTWAEMGKKYPLSYAEAFFAGNVGYYTFLPKLEGGASYNGQAGNRLVFETYDVGEAPEYLHTQQSDLFYTARLLLAAYARGWRHVPLCSLTYCCAVYTWLLVGAGLSLARRKQWRRLAAFLPALLSLGVCMLSPVNDYFRYFLPVVAMTAPLLGFAGETERRGRT